ncbi:MAG: hypothetical protein JNN07_27040 [Verrucomicrobiales bacterium]|nr:hypothetical protein [Verrucomicrobiales bacterium]
MPRKPFEETPYDPIAADLVREVVATRRHPVVARAPATIAAPEPTRSGMTLVSAPTSDSAEPKSPEPSITKRFLLNRSENEDLEAFLLRLQKQAGTKVTLSMFTRAVFNVVMQAESALLAEVGQGKPRRFPSTHDSIAQGIFEDWWMRCVTNALRTLPRAGALGPR